MKSMYTVATIALLAAASIGNAQAKPVDPCAVNQAANAAIIAKAQAAKTPAERKAILDAAIKANPANAVCIADLALQVAQASTGISPAAGPEEGFAGDVPGTTDGTPAPTENPNQLNQGAGAGTNSPAAPAL